MTCLRTWSALSMAFAMGWLPLAVRQTDQPRNTQRDPAPDATGGRGEQSAAADGSDEEEKLVPTLPGSRGGQDVIGQTLPDFQFDAWLNDDDNAAEMRTGRVTLYRWWTNTCPHCKASLPAFEELRKEYEDKGLVVVAVYHPKPPRSVDPDFARREAAELGFHGPVAVDADWSELRAAYLDKVKRSATSISLLADRDGVIRFVHPGPVLFPSDDPEHEQENADYELLKEAARVLLE